MLTHRHIAALVVGGITLAGFLLALVIVATDEWRIFRAKQEVKTVLDAAKVSKPPPAVGTHDSAKRFALTVLSKHGITRLADNISVNYSDGLWSVSGPAMLSNGKTTNVALLFQAGQFDDKIRWKLISAVVGGEPIE